MSTLSWQGGWLTAAGKVRGRTYQLQVELVHEVMLQTPAGPAYVRTPMCEVLTAKDPMIRGFKADVQRAVEAVRQALATKMNNSEVRDLFERTCATFLHTDKMLILSGQPPLIGEVL